MTSTNEKYNKDELEAPDWLNAQFFEKVLKTYEKDDKIKVKNITLSPATALGDHYASVMFRAALDYTNGRGVNAQKSLIIKTMPETEGHKKNMIGDSHIFETEIGMYTEVIPKFERMLREIGDETVLGAPCVYHSLSPRKLIIFEDICKLGYETVRERVINEDEVRAAYTKIAKWHALSYKIAKENPAFFEIYRYNLMAIPNFDKEEFITDGIINFMELLKREPTLNQYVPHFEKLQPTLMQRLAQDMNEYRVNAQSNGVYVLCHGDFHGKNMMFKRNKSNGALEDVMLLDFQMSSVTSCAYDLIYSFYMLMNMETRRTNKDELIHFYFQIFLDTLVKLKFVGKLPTMLELRQNLLRHRRFELFLVVTFLPLINSFYDGSFDPSELVQSADTRGNLYKNKLYIEELHTLLPQFLYRGYFDV